MEHSKNFEKIKSYYDKGLWDKARVRAVVGTLGYAHLSCRCGNR